MITRAIGSPSDGDVEVVGARGLRYLPDAGFLGTDSVTYEITDGHELDGTLCTSTARAEFRVRASNENLAPRVLPDEIEAIAGDAPKEAAVLGNDIDPDGDALSVVGKPVIRPLGALNATIAAGRLMVEAPAGVNATDAVVEYAVTDGVHDVSSVLVVHVVDGQRNMAPVVAPDSANVPVGVASTLDVLANDRDPEGGRLEITNVAATAGMKAWAGGNRVTVFSEVEGTGSAVIRTRRATSRPPG